jgi:hypothetical protein
MACRSMAIDLSLLRPPWKRQRVFGIACSRSWRQADSMLIGLDRALNEAAEAFRSQPPDFNESTTKVRIALETIARGAAPTIAAHRGIPAPGDTWGAALGFLRMTAQLMTVQEEQAVSAVYTLISSGAHRPVGLTDEEWARLARTFALSATYFLVRKYRTAS